MHLRGALTACAACALHDAEMSTKNAPFECWLISKESSFVCIFDFKTNRLSS